MTLDRIHIAYLVEQFLSNQGGMTLAEMLIKTGMCESKSSAKRDIEQNAVKISGYKVRDKHARVYNFNGCMILIEQNSDGTIDITTQFGVEE